MDIALYSQNLKGIGGKNLNTKFKSFHVYLRNTKFFNKLSAVFHIRELFTRYDLMHITHNFEYVANPKNCIVTIHDAFFMKINETQFNHLAMRKEVPEFAKRCRHIITCSEYSKKDIIETMGINPAKITVIPWGIDHTNFYIEDDCNISKSYLEIQYDIRKPYFLSVSCNAERKRTDVLVKAYLTYIRDNNETLNDLVLVWNNPPSELKEYISKFDVKLQQRIHFLHNVSNDDLRKLYNCATASFTPSSYEGFGLPILEAMACGCPVVAANNSSLPEVGGDAAIYVDEPIHDSLIDIISKIESNSIDLNSLSNKGIEHAAKYTWGRAAKATIELYNKLLK